MPRPEWGFGVFALQGLVMAVDEWCFHRRRGLPRWERIGHPVDTLALLSCLLLILFCPPTRPFSGVYLGMAVFSCLVITKDEFIHAGVCSGGEHWLHSILFILHPLALLSAAWLWPAIHSREGGIWLAFLFQVALIGAFLIFQVVYWLCRDSSQMRS